MPSACPVESHDGCYGKDQKTFLWMPRAWPVEVHDGCYAKRPEDVSLDATGLARGGSRWLLRKKARRRLLGCHGLGPWRFTMVATQKGQKTFPWMPPACPVEVHVYY